MFRQMEDSHLGQHQSILLWSTRRPIAYFFCGKLFQRVYWVRIIGPEFAGEHGLPESLRCMALEYNTRGGELYEGESLRFSYRLFDLKALAS